MVDVKTTLGGRKDEQDLHELVVSIKVSYHVARGGKCQDADALLRIQNVWKSSHNVNAKPGKSGEVQT